MSTEKWTDIVVRQTHEGGESGHMEAVTDETIETVAVALGVLFVITDFAETEAMVVQTAKALRIQDKVQAVVKAHVAAAQAGRPVPLFKPDPYADLQPELPDILTEPWVRHY